MVPLVGLQLLQLPNNVCSISQVTQFRNSCCLPLENIFPNFPLPVLAEYNSDLSCHYKVELSYENLVTSGPDPHPPPIADDESDDEDDDDVPRVSFSFFISKSVLVCSLNQCVSDYVGGSLRLAGKSLGDQSVPYYSETIPK